MGLLRDIFGPYVGLLPDDDFVNTRNEIASGVIENDAPPRPIRYGGPLSEATPPFQYWKPRTYERCDCGSEWCACGRPFNRLGCACGYCSCGKKRVSTKQKLDSKKDPGDNKVMPMKTTEMLDKAISITAQAFLGKTDKSGIPYILHCIHVMREVQKRHPKDWELHSIAVLHDLVEDTNWTLEMLRDEGFSHRIVRGVEVLTHDPEVPYDDYIKHIGMYEDARHVKLADLRHNSDIMRIKGLTQRDIKRVEKYHRSYTYLSKK